MGILLTSARVRIISSIISLAKTCSYLISRGVVIVLDHSYRPTAEEVELEARQKFGENGQCACHAPLANSATAESRQVRFGR